MIDIIGKKGSGKNYIANILCNQGYNKTVILTTKKNQSSKIDGISYRFITIDDFIKLMEKGFLAGYHKSGNDYYGILKDDLTLKSIIFWDDIKKLREEIGLPITSIYVDADLNIRYQRMLKSKVPKNEIFMQLHNDNFAYLGDFDSVFIDNNGKTDIMNSVIDAISEPSIKQISNRDFLMSKTTIGSNSPNPVVKLLKFEEYLLRKFYLEGKDLNNPETEQEYKDLMVTFARFIGIKNKIIDGDLHVSLGLEKYQFDYQIRSRIKK